VHFEHALSLEELLSESVPLSAQDVAALVGQLCRHVDTEPVELGAAPVEPRYVWLVRDGTVQLSRGVLPSIENLGALLEQLIGEVRRTGPARIPPGLVFVAARAAGRLDAAPFESLEAMAAALARFEPADRTAALQTLFNAVAAVRAGGDDAAAAADVEDASPLDDPPGVWPEELPRRPASFGVRPRVAVAFAAAGLVAGIGVAVGLYGPAAPTPRVTNETEVLISPSTGKKKDADSSPRAASNTGRRPRATPPSSTPNPVREPIGERAPATTVRASRTPQPLIDRSQVDADAVFSPSFAPNGSAVFFHAETNTGSSLKRADAGEGGVLHVTTIVDDAAKNYHVQLSPDSRWVTFDSDRDGVRGVYLARADGSGVRRVSGPGYAAVATWAPDGRRLAFLRAESERPAVWNLWVLDLNSDEMTRLTNHRYGQVWGGAWFPDGRRIAYSHEAPLIVLDLDSGRSVSYASPRKGRLVRTPAVSPNGRWIMFQVFRDGAWLMDLDTGSMERVLDDPSAEEFTWAPDGRRVAFHSRRQGGWGLWTMSPR
jgi:hypothetical protein